MILFYYRFDSNETICGPINLIDALNRQQRSIYNKMEDNAGAKVDIKSTDSKDTMTKSRALLIVTSTSGISFLFGFQFSAFAAYYVVMTQHFDVSKAAAGWIGSIQFGLGGLLGRVFI